MPRPPDPDSKTARLIHDAQDTGQEMRIRGFKEVCARDGLEMNHELDLLITTWLGNHHWPPGNPQTQIDREWTNGEQSGVEKMAGAIYNVRCRFCGRWFETGEDMTVPNCPECVKQEATWVKIRTDTPPSRM